MLRKIGITLNVLVSAFGILLTLTHSGINSLTLLFVFVLFPVQVFWSVLLCGFQAGKGKITKSTILRLVLSVVSVVLYMSMLAMFPPAFLVGFVISPALSCIEIFEFMKDKHKRELMNT